MTTRFESAASLKRQVKLCEIAIASFTQEYVTSNLIQTIFESIFLVNYGYSIKTFYDRVMKLSQIEKVTIDK